MCLRRPREGAKLTRAAEPREVSCRRSEAMCPSRADAVSLEGLRCRADGQVQHAARSPFFDLATKNEYILTILPPDADVERIAPRAKREIPDIMLSFSDLNTSHYGPGSSRRCQRPGSLTTQRSGRSAYPVTRPAD